MHDHPAFIRARNLEDERWRAHFPKSVEEARDFIPCVLTRALAANVLCVARTRVECAWAAYVDAVPGINHKNEIEAVLDRGAKLPENVARAVFRHFGEVPYAE